MRQARSDLHRRDAPALGARSSLISDWDSLAKAAGVGAASRKLVADAHALASARRCLTSFLNPQDSSAAELLSWHARFGT